MNAIPWTPRTPRPLLPGSRGCRAFVALGYAALLAASSRLAQAEDDAGTQDDSGAPPGVTALPTATDATTAVSFAAGVSFAYLSVEQLSDDSRFAFTPSIVGLAYVPLAPRWFLRPGLRLGYAGLDPAPSSYGARVDEHDLQGSAELSIEYDAWLVPAFGVGLGLNRRAIDFVGRGIVQDSDAIDRTEWLGLAYAQAGIGVPFADGWVVLEPYARAQWTFSDDRSLLQFGADLTVAF